MITDIIAQVALGSKMGGNQATTVVQNEFQYPSQDVRLKKSCGIGSMMRRSNAGGLKQEVGIGSLIHPVF